MSDRTILLTRALPAAMQDALAAVGDLVLFDEADAEQLAKASILVSTAVDTVDAARIKRLGQHTGLIANIGVGTDNIDLQQAAKQGVKVANTPVVTEDSADLAMALLLAASRRLSFCEQALRAGKWNAGAAVLGQRVYGKTLGIVGLGAIGAAVARRALGFNMRILYTGPSPKPDLEKKLAAEYVADLDDLLASVDFLSLHCPLSSDNHHLLDRARFELCKPGMVLVNTGRGPLIDEQAMIEALQNGLLGAAGLDVFEFEPDVSAELLALDNVTALPHIGSATGECRTDMAICTLRNIQSFLAAGTPENLVSAARP